MPTADSADRRRSGVVGSGLNGDLLALSIAQNRQFDRVARCLERDVSQQMRINDIRLKSTKRLSR